VVKLHQAEYTAQKRRKEAKAKAREKAERKRIAEKKKKKRTLEYLQQLQDEVLEEEAALLKVVEPKHKKAPQEMIWTTSLPKRLK